MQEGDDLVEWMLGHVWDGRVDPGNQRQRGVSASPRATCMYGQTVRHGTARHQRGNRIKCSKINQFSINYIIHPIGAMKMRSCYGGWKCSGHSNKKCQHHFLDFTTLGIS